MTGQFIVHGRSNDGLDNTALLTRVLLHTGIGYEDDEVFVEDYRSLASQHHLPARVPVAEGDGTAGETRPMGIQLVVLEPRKNA